MCGISEEEEDMVVGVVVAENNQKKRKFGKYDGKNEKYAKCKMQVSECK